jgi:hypothetical protein
MVAQWTITVLKNDMQKTLIIQSYFNAYSICDVLNRDLVQAPLALTYWKLISADSVIWSDGKKDIGWECKNGILSRSVGNYDITTQKWISQKRAIAFKGLDSITFIAHISGQTMSCMTYALLAKRNDKVVEVKQRSILVNGAVV